MKARVILLAVSILITHGALAGPTCVGNKNCNTYNDDHSTTNKAYGGDGGDANVGNGFGNFSPSAKAYGGDAKAYGGDADVDIYNKNSNYNTNLNSNKQELYNANIGVNKQGQDQGQYQGQGQQQGQVGIVKDGDQVLVIKDNSVRTSEVNAEPAIAPDISPPDPTAPCLATYGAGGAGGGVVSLGFSAYEYDEICGALEFYRVAGKTHVELADVAVKLAHAMLLKKIKDEMGEEDYNAALNPEQSAAAAPAEGTTASLDVAYANNFQGSQGR